MPSAHSADDVKLAASFQTVCQQLLADPDAERLNKPLAFWVLPTDRRLPLAFLSRSIRELAEKSYSELAATPGVGHKKMGSLVQLLSRAATTEPTEYPVLAASNTSPQPAQRVDSDTFDPTTVSELLWAQWRETVRA